jgi:uncharacterized protein (TIGR02145 family)/uncharacterized repeat protein (TIGR02543 family)
MRKNSILKTAVIAAFAALFCIGCGDNGDDGDDDGKPPYTITFNARGGTVSPTSGKTGMDGKLDSLPTPTRDEYTFAGWYTEYRDGTAVTMGTIFNTNATVYAQWGFIITFDANGGTVNPASGIARENISSGKLDSLPTPTRTGYAFNGWYSTDTWLQVDQRTSYYKNTTVYSKWTATGVPTPDKTTFVDSRDGKTYNKVVIGDQTWMAENLNYAIAGSKCYGEGGEVRSWSRTGGWHNDTLTNAEVQANCDKYGRLYAWTTAMGVVDTIYNNSYLGGGRDGTDVNQRGICPFGWHIPSVYEWMVLKNYVGKAPSTGWLFDGTKLKSSTDWFDVFGNPIDGWGNPIYGTDDYGFTALPGGTGDSDGYFDDAGNHGYWWGASEGSLPHWALILDIDERDGEGSTSYHYWDKTALLSVRCVAD